MKTLFVENEATELRYERQVIIIYQANKRLTTIPVLGLERIIISPHITLAAGVLGLLTENNVALFVFNARHPRRSAYLSTGEIGDSCRRIAQYELLKEPLRRLELSKRIVTIKIRKQRILLKKVMVQRPDIHKMLFDAVRQLSEASYKAKALDYNSTLSTLRGIEGAAANCFFSAYQSLFPDSFGFTNRNRRPPRDPVNVLLSLTYSLIYHESIAALKSAGLDPMLACYHEIHSGRASLACDLVELLRAEVEEWIWRLCQSRTIRIDHFEQQSHTCLLTHKGKTNFYELYLNTVPQWRRKLRYYSRTLAHYIDGAALHERNS